MTDPKALAETIMVYFARTNPNLNPNLAKDIESLLREAMEEALAKRDLEQFGESFMLGGKRISPNDIHKSVADYVKEAKAAAYEDCAQIAENSKRFLVFNITHVIVHELISNVREQQRKEIADEIRSRASELGKP